MESNKNDDTVDPATATATATAITTTTNKYELVTIKSINLDELTRLVWGKDVRDDVFERWSQGFTFAQTEQTALLQLNGGPCAVIAPVQAYLLKDLLFCANCKNDWRHIDENELNVHLANSFLSLYLNLCSDTPKYLVIYDDNSSSTPSSSSQETTTAADSSSSSDNKQESSTTTDNNEDKSDNNKNCAKRIKLDHLAFLDKLKIYKFESLNDLKKLLYEQIGEFRKRYGVLCLLYSLILTKGVAKLTEELEDSIDQLIDSVYGHGSQNLINLMICGIATSNIFDGDKSLEGLKLQGIQKQSTIGFLTIMEYLRYCEVGWYLKNPKFPIWILASETHLTVFFSKETKLVQKDESPRQNAIKNFCKYDPDANGFVKTEDLQNLMRSLDLVSENEYVDIVRQQLDSENLGIITKAAFLNEFYPDTEQNVIPAKFDVYHYNGLTRSNKDNQVEYVVGEAKIKDFEDQPSLDVNSIKNCLQTKWPTMEVDWQNGRIPSLN